MTEKVIERTPYPGKPTSGKVVYVDGVHTATGLLLAPGMYHVRLESLSVDSERAPRAFLTAPSGPVFIDTLPLKDGNVIGLWTPTREDLSSGYKG